MIADYNVAVAMLKYYINAAVGNFVILKPVVVVGVPTGGATEVEKKVL